MDLPELIKVVYKTNEVIFTGLYSFEFVDENRNTITEIFFMIPPKTKSVDEPSRSSTIPTLGSNYTLDAGNGIKSITLSGDLYFPYVGSPKNPVARFNTDLPDAIDGKAEFFKLRWMLSRYRDYTMKKSGKIVDPGWIKSASPGIDALYRRVSKNLSKQIGALYDKIEMIFHDYDMDDHWYCRVSNFSSSQSDAKHLAISYAINLDCYEPNSKAVQSTNIKKTTNEMINTVIQLLDDLGYGDRYGVIQPQIGYNVEFVSALVAIGNTIDLVIAENELIQSGKSTANTILPTYNETLLNSTVQALDDYITFFIPAEMLDDYYDNEMTIDEIMDIDLVSFYNTLQKVKLYSQNIQGVLNTIIQQESIRFSENADNYRITEEQFDSDDSYKVENDTSFYYYTVMGGDTARVIALRELQDRDKFVKILQVNDITENDFIDGTLVGSTIKIPILSKTVSAGDDNMVYETNVDDIENFYHGKDIALGVNSEILISATGDILDKRGIANTIDNIENRLTSPKGSLNIFNPNWGVTSIGSGNAPMLVRLERYLNSVNEQIQSDPRIEAAKMDYSNINFTGERITVPVKLTFLGSDDIKEVTANG
jgi:hypothetical protein